MKLERYACFIALIMGLFFASCEKEESPIVLPPKGTAEVERVDMGEDYENQVFYDFETHKVVMHSKVSSWDLGFEAATDGIHVFINGGKNIFCYNTHVTDINSIKTANALIIPDTTWQFDAACGLRDSTAVGNWADNNNISKQEIYILKFSDNTYKKIVIESVNNEHYVLKYGDIEAASLSSITIPKNPDYNYSYFSFDNGGVLVSPEPPKDSWDIVFTRYRYIYYELQNFPQNFPYLVNGALLNPYNTSAMADSNTSFKILNYNPSLANSYSDHRDVIGFDWKQYNFTTGKYDVHPEKCYMVKTRNDQYWKIHFLDFYSLTGVKGSPSFEFERVH